MRPAQLDSSRTLKISASIALWDVPVVEKQPAVSSALKVSKWLQTPNTASKATIIKKLLKSNKKESTTADILAHNVMLTPIDVQLVPLALS